MEIENKEEAILRYFDILDLPTMAQRKYMGMLNNIQTKYLSTGKCVRSKYTVCSAGFPAHV